MCISISIVISIAIAMSISITITMDSQAIVDIHACCFIVRFVVVLSRVCTDISNATVYAFKGMGHCPMEEQPATTAAQAMHFLNTS